MLRKLIWLSKDTKVVPDKSRCRTTREGDWPTETNTGTERTKRRATVAEANFKADESAL